MKEVSAVERFFPSAKGPVPFAIHQLFAVWGPLYTAPWVLTFVEELRGRLGFQVSLAQGRWLLYGTPFFPTQVVLALLLGWVLGGTLRHRAMLWTWILPLLSLCLALIGVQLLPASAWAWIYYPEMRHLAIVQAASLGLRREVAIYFGWGRWIQPFNQVAVTLPFYAAAAYSLGAWLALGVLRAPVFFETLRNLRKGRLFLCVALPWFCLNWFSPGSKASPGTRFCGLGPNSSSFFTG
jgi:uncharacterized protein (DUF2062 family)